MSRCPHCGGDVTITRRRAWCLKHYDDGGCGAFFRLRDKGWERVRRMHPPGKPPDFRLRVVS